MNILYVDDEISAVEKFKRIASALPDIRSVTCFTDTAEAFAFVSERSASERIQLAFLDIDMPECDGLEFTQKLKEFDPIIEVAFVTAYGEYALKAFGVSAIGYILKPYSAQSIQQEIEKVKRMKPRTPHKVFIKTMPYFDVYIDGKLLPISSSKPKELLALLVDRNGSSVTPGVAIACLWDDRPSDAATNSLYRMTSKRLRELLAGAGIEYIIGANGSCRFACTDAYGSDCEKLFEGDKEALRSFGGSYMDEYSWAEDTKARFFSQSGKENY